MSISFENSINNLVNELENKVNSLNGEVPFDILFNKNFMKRNTNFNSFDELLEAGNFIVNTQEDFEAIPDDVFDKHIMNCTKFNSWEEMMQEAGEAYVVSQLKL